MSNEVSSTYRIQLNADFEFHRVASIARYLADLGVTHLYCSPYLQSAEGSEHGYDVIEHPKFNSELGGPEGFREMLDALGAAGLGHIVDIVPNHVSTEGNSRWWSVLEHGRESVHEHWFDIDWDGLDGKIVVPLLGDDLEACLERGEIILDTSETPPILRYFEHTLPLKPETDLDAPLADIIASQHYWLVEWRRGDRNLNYRRFFDVSTLPAIQVHLDDVFDSSHALVLGLIAEGVIAGLRVDHIDGLRDPQGYLDKLADRASVPIWVEKILEPGEKLPATWPVEGTTGYDFLNVVGGLFLDPNGEDGLTDTYAGFTGDSLDLLQMAREAKMYALRFILLPEIKRLYRQAEAILEPAEDEDREGQLMAALAETAAAFEVYRTYVRPDGSFTVDDERLLVDAFETAKGESKHISAETWESLGDVLLAGQGGDAGLELLLRFQQTTGPVMAKGVEDTLFYRFNRLVALNEVGGDPGYFGTSVDEFHTEALQAVIDKPRSMLATSTHDTKRSEDVRARLALLSEIPERWGEAVERWSKLADRHRTNGMPDAGAEYLLYQTLVGAHPIGADRATEYMLKAAREAKLKTSWIHGHPDYEAALNGFVRGLLADAGFAADLESFVEPLVEPGRINSLAQTLIKLTYPGVPDTYQGSELWDLSLVDPDNRRPVDFDVRASLLAHIDETPAAELWAFPDDGGPKMLVTARALQVRKRMPDVFIGGGYTALHAEGDASRHVVAYLRKDAVAVVVPRLPIGLDGRWGDTTVPLADGKWHNELTGETVYGGNVEVGRLLDGFPVALLVRGEGIMES